MSGSDVMKEIRDIAPSILVLIVTAYGDEGVEVEAFRSSARNYLKKPRRKNILPGPDAPELPGTQPSTVTLSQYLKILQAVRFYQDNDQTDIRLKTQGRQGCFHTLFLSVREDRSVLSGLSE